MIGFFVKKTEKIINIYNIKTNLYYAIIKEIVVKSIKEIK